MGEYGHIFIANHINSILEFISMIELTIWTAFFPCMGTNYGVNLGEKIHPVMEVGIRYDERIILSRLGVEW